MHYLDLGDVQQGKPLPGKASLRLKNIFSCTGLRQKKIKLRQVEQSNEGMANSEHCFL